MTKSSVAAATAGKMTLFTFDTLRRYRLDVLGMSEKIQWLSSPLTTPVVWSCTVCFKGGIDSLFLLGCSTCQVTDSSPCILHAICFVIWLTLNYWQVPRTQ